MTKLSAEERDALPAREFAFPAQRKLPIEDATHVRGAIARFNQVKGVRDDERDEAWARILRAAKKHEVEVHEQSWRELNV